MKSSSMTDSITPARRWLRFGALALMALGVWFVQPRDGQRARGDPAGLVAGLVLVAVGGVMLLLDQRGGEQESLPKPAGGSPENHPIYWSLFAAGAIMLALLAEANGLIFGTLLSGVSHHVQFVLLVGGVTLVVVGLGRPQWRTWSWPDRREALLVLALTGAALLLRAWRLDDTVRVFVDELNFASVVDLFEGPERLRLLEPMNYIVTFPRLYPYLQTWTVDLLGHNFAGLRAVSVLLGTFTIPALYLLARESFDRQTAWLAAALLAVFPPHLHFSRLGINNIADPLFGVLALAFLARGLRTNRRLDYALAGAALGLTQYFYEGGRLVYPMLVVLWLGIIVLLWRPWRHLPGLLMTLMTALAVAAPLYYTLLGLGASLTPRFDQVGLHADFWSRLAEDGLIKPYGDHLVDALVAPFHLVDSSGFYLGEWALLLPVMALPVFGGLFVLARRWRSPGSLLLSLWLLLTILGNSLLAKSTLATRYVIAFPLYVMLAALGVQGLIRAVWPAGWPARRALIGLVVAALAVVQVGYYFGPHLALFNVQVRDRMDGHDALLRVIGYRPGTHVHLVSTQVFSDSYARDLAAYFADGLVVDVVAPQELARGVGAAFPTDVDHVFFLEPDDRLSLEVLRARFTCLPPQVTTNADVPPEKAFVLYYAPCCLGETP